MDRSFHQFYPRLSVTLGGWRLVELRAMRGKRFHSAPLPAPKPALGGQATAAVAQSTATAKSASRLA